MDRNLLGKGSIDAYILCQYLNNKLKTKVITAPEGEQVDWNYEFLVIFICTIKILLFSYHANFL